MSKNSKTQVKPTHDQVAVAAYHIYEKSGCEPGCCDDNWHKAEVSLQDKTGE